MKLVKWDSTQNKFVVDETNSSYSYDGINNQWANAIVTTKDESNQDIESYFVWIPRYAYKITYTNPDDISSGGTIDIKFLEGTGSIASDGTVCKYANDETLNRETDYIIHPAFTSDMNNGGWSEELPGIWIGKYEASRSDAGTTKDETGTSEKIAVIPGVTSWRNTSIGDIYNYAKKYDTTLNSHLLKNSEWGAISYLAESKYGRNGIEVTINNSSNYITGSAGNNVSADEDVGTTNEYWSAQGVLASSTGNVYGVYDLSGGTYEYVTAYYNGSTDSNLINNGSSFASQGGTSTEFSTAYTGTEESLAYKLGDATYETNKWHSDYAYFVDKGGPFFMRGGRYNSSSNSGCFYYCNSYGNADENNGFRICLTIK